MTATSNIGNVSDTISLSCSSDLRPLRIKWYKDNTLLSQTYGSSGTVTTGIISTDDQGAVYTCSAISHYGSQEENVTLNVEGTKFNALN